MLTFWGHRPAKDGRLTKSCLSQWWPSAFTVEGVLYLTAEHWMMAQKASAFGDAEVAAAVLAAKTPAQAKRLGRAVRGFDAAEWDCRKFDVVVEGSVHKFGRDQALGQFLAETGEDVLVEASPADSIWGVGLAADDPRVADPTLWLGENLLGFALMAARRRLRP